MFNFDFDLFRDRYLPEHWRTPAVKDWIFSLFAPLKTLHQEFLDYRDVVLFDVAFNGQTIHLEFVLNELFAPGVGGIFIETQKDESLIFLSNKIENQPKIFLFNKSELEPPIFLKNRAERLEFNFIVFVPVAIVFDEDELKAKINFYRLAGKTFKIETY